MQRVCYLLVLDSVTSTNTHTHTHMHTHAHTHITSHISHHTHASHAHTKMASRSKTQKHAKNQSPCPNVASIHSTPRLHSPLFFSPASSSASSLRGSSSSPSSASDRAGAASLLSSSLMTISFCACAFEHAPEHESFCIGTFVLQISSQLHYSSRSKYCYSSTTVQCVQIRCARVYTRALPSAPLPNVHVIPCRHPQS